MNWVAIVGLVVQLLPLASQIAAAWESSTSNGIGKVQDVIRNTPVVGTLADIGAQLFPKLSPELHAAAAALVLAHPNSTSWLQSALNVLKATGYVAFGADLKVDGVYGPKTFAAVEAVQAKLKFPVNGFIADVEYNAIAALLAKV